MKFCILLVALIVAVAEVKCDSAEDMQKFDIACRAESNVSEKDVDEFFDRVANGEANDALKCHLKCLMEKQGHWKNGGFDSAAAMLELHPDLKDHQDKINEIIENCKDEEGTSECDTAYLITKCVIDSYADAM